jgi:hypothetical protein
MVLHTILVLLEDLEVPSGNSRRACGTPLSGSGIQLAGDSLESYRIPKDLPTHPKPPRDAYYNARVFRGVRMSSTIQNLHGPTYLSCSEDSVSGLWKFQKILWEPSKSNFLEDLIGEQRLTIHPPNYNYRSEPPRFIDAPRGPCGSAQKSWRDPNIYRSCKGSGTWFGKFQKILWKPARTLQESISLEFLWKVL